MAVNYAIPPWIHGAETANQYGRGYALGQQGAESAARLQLASMQLAAEQARHERDMTYRQQQAEIEKAMQEQRMSFEKQEFDARMQQSQQQLQLQQQEFQLRSQQAAQKTAAMMGFQKDMQAELESGGDGTKSILKWGALMGGQGSPEAAAIRAANMKRAQPPEQVKGEPVMGADGKPIPGVFATRTSQGAPEIHNIPGTGRSGAMSPEDREAMTEARNELLSFQKKWNDPLAARLKLTPQGKKEFEADQAAAADAANTLREIAPNSPLASRFMTPPGGAAPAAPGGPVRWTKDSSGKPVPEAGTSPAGGALTQPAPAPGGAGPGAPSLPWPLGGTGEEGPPKPPPGPGNPNLFWPAGGGTPLSQMRVPAPQAPTQSGPEVPAYIQSYREELAKAGGGLTKGAKDYLSDMIAGLSDEALAAAANKHGIDDVVFKDGGFLRSKTLPEKRVDASQGKPFPFDPDATEGIGRMDVEDDLYNSAQVNGWQLPWPE